MAKQSITKSAVNTTNITDLEPVVVGQANTLQPLFDKGTLDTKTYINDVLTEELNGNNGAFKIGLSTLELSADNVGDGLKELAVEKLDQGGNFTGTWQGYNPVQTDPGIQAIVNEHSARLQRLEIDQYHLFVGTNQTYQTIQSAVDKWEELGRPKATIFIYNGEYNESIFIGSGSNISFIGETKEGVIWRTKTGYYKDAPLHVQGGLIKNITFIADITDNPGFVYVPLQNGNPFVDEIGSAYGLHVDFSGATGKTVVENCTCISYVNAGLGAGTKINQTFELKNTEIYSYTPQGFDSQAFDNGAFVLKSELGNDITGQHMNIYNNKIYSENGKALQFLNQSLNAGCELFIQFTNNNLETKNFNNLVTFSSSFGLYFSETSFGNNSDKLNFINLVNENGYNVVYTDFNSVKKTTNFYVGTGGLNLPIVGSSWLGSSVALSDDYVIQYAWRFTDTAQLYKRYYKEGVWSSWSRCVDTLTETRDFLNLDSAGYSTAKNTDANNCKETGCFYCTSNTPTGAGSLIQTITANASYGVQYGWILTTGAKYKRTLLNNVWSGWTAITEP